MIPWSGTSSRLRPTLTATATAVAGNENSVRPVRPRITHKHQVERVERGPGGQRPDRLVRLEVAVVGERLDQPRRQEPKPEHGERADRNEPGHDQRVDAAGLVVVLDRVRQRWPGEVEAADQHLHAVRELDRDRVEADRRSARQAQDDEPVDPIQRVERQLRRHRRQSEPDHPSQQRPVDAEAEPPTFDPQAPDEEQHSGAEVAEQDRGGAEVGATSSPTVTGITTTPSQS